MPLTKLQFKPGINRETTSYTNEGGWYDMDKVRFRFGFPEKIGGWARQSPGYFLGTARALHPWAALDGSQYLGVGTNLKYYINEGGGFYDITPVRETTTAGSITFAAAATTLSANITAEAETIPLTSASGFPATGVIQIGSETIQYAAVSGNNLTGCVRGINSTTAAAHSSTDAVGSATLVVTASSDHGLNNGDFVTFFDAASLGGNITAAILNQEYEVFSVISSTVFYINARSVNPLAGIADATGYAKEDVFANSSDSGNGGSSTYVAYQITIGLDTAVGGTGWGSSTWSRGTWGSPAALIFDDTLRLWSQDNFGEDLIINPRDGGIYYWDKSSGLSTRAVSLSERPGATSAPTIASQVLVSDRDRHVIAFGCDSESSPGVQDPLLIRFSDQENPAAWNSTATNTAGELRLGNGSEIVQAVETRQQIIVFTDVSLNAMQFLGPPFTFGIGTISENITIISPNAAVAVEDNVFWMGKNEFYAYSGAVQRLPCTVRDYVFSDINLNQLQKVTASTNAAFSEIIWFYPSGASDECDRYVIYNYQQQIWYYGTLTRTVWLDRSLDNYPIAAGTDQSLYFHELGFDDGSTSPASAIASYIESSQIDIGEGDSFAFITRLIPDLTFRASTASAPAALITVKTRNYPGGQYVQSTASSVEKTASVPVEQFTEQVNIRLRGRSFAMRVENDQLGATWRLGSPRLDIRLDGRR